MFSKSKNIIKIGRYNLNLRLVVIIALFAAVVLGIYTLIGILAQANVIKSDSISFVRTEDYTIKFTAYGIIALVMLGIDLLF
jgi:hypothetical protein